MNENNLPKSKATSKAAIRKGSTVAMRRREEFKQDMDDTARYSEAVRLNECNSKHSKLSTNWENVCSTNALNTNSLNEQDGIYSQVNTDPIIVKDNSQSYPRPQENLQEIKTISYDIDHEEINIPGTKSTNEIFPKGLGTNSPVTPERLTKELSFNLDYFLSKKSNPNMPIKFDNSYSSKKRRNGNRDKYMGHRVIPRPDCKNDKKNSERVLDDTNELSSLLNSKKIPILSNKFQH